MSGMSAGQLAYQEANINANRGPEIIAICSVFTGLAVLCCGLRLIARRIARAGWGLDDYLVVSATITLIGLDISAGLMVRYGAGRHTLWLAQHPENIVNMGKAEIPYSAFYHFTMTLAKLSALTFIVRIFTTNDPVIRYGSYLLGLYLILWWIAGLLVIFLQCQPFSSYWGDPNTCQIRNATSISVAAFDIFSDVAVLLLPQRSIWRLQLTFKKKLGLSLMFFLGFCGTAITIARVPLLIGDSTVNDTSGHLASSMIFTVLEPATAIICTCLPILPRCYQPVKSWMSKAQSSRRVLPYSEDSRNMLPVTTQSSQVGRWHKLDSTQVVRSAESTEGFEFRPLGASQTQHV